VCELKTLSINNGVIIQKNRKQQKTIHFKQNLPREKANAAKLQLQPIGTAKGNRPKKDKFSIK
jgi:hypothetical protein